MKYRVEIPDYYSIRLRALLFLEAIRAEESESPIIHFPVKGTKWKCNINNVWEDVQIFHKSEIKHIKTKIERQLELKFKQEKQPEIFKPAKSLYDKYKSKQISDKELSRFNNPKFYEKYVHKYEYRTIV